MHLFDTLAEQRIQDALARGELDNLPGAGKPLDLDEDPLVPAEVRMMNRILRNAGGLPRELLLRREAQEIYQRLRAARDDCPLGEETRIALLGRLQDLNLQIDGAFTAARP